MFATKSGKVHFICTQVSLEISEINSQKVSILQRSLKYFTFDLLLALFVLIRKFGEQHAPFRSMHLSGSMDQLSKSAHSCMCHGISDRVSDRLRARNHPGRAPGGGGTWTTNIRGRAAGKSKKLPCPGVKFPKMIPCPGVKFS